MRVIRAKNVQAALKEATKVLRNETIKRNSRNGVVFRHPELVTTVYESPCERVLFWPQRDANPFLHLYESLWMLDGRNDIAPLLKFTKQFAEYSDDGITQHGAYGFRWRKHFGKDQLVSIIGRLRGIEDDRRSVLDIWDATEDLDRNGKDVPCNLSVTFEVLDGRLNMAVFCRSNDIIWGAYGANAVHFSMLQEYMAMKIGVAVGIYTQISANWHAYEGELLNRVKDLWKENGYNSIDPYITRDFVPMPSDVDEVIPLLLHFVDFDDFNDDFKMNSYWSEMVYAMFKAHYLWRTLLPPEKFEAPLEILSDRFLNRADWICAGKEWIERRKQNWLEKIA
jgi:thymidylate synthase